MPKLITLEEVAARIGVSRRTVDRYITRGDFIALYQMPTGSLRCDECDLNDWLQKLRKEPQRKETQQ